MRRTCDGCDENKFIHARRPDGARLCRWCQINDPAWAKPCGTCGVTEHLFHRGLCGACALAEWLTDVLSAGTGAIRPGLAPLYDCLNATPDPVATILWLRRPSPRRALAELVEAVGPLTHEQIDALHPRFFAQRLRGVLVVAGTLPPRDEHLVELEDWLCQRLAQIGDPAERGLVSGFAQWHHLRRLRKDSARQPISQGQAQVVRREIGMAIRLLAWLREHDRSLDSITQLHVDSWFTVRSRMRASLSFLRWCVRQGHVGSLRFPTQTQEQPKHFTDEDQRWHAVRRFLHDDTLPTPVRFAGLLVLLFGQPVARICRLPADRLEHTETGTFLRLAQQAIALPRPLDILATDLAGGRRGWAPVGPETVSPWLFPGALPGRHLSPSMLGRHLRDAGLDIRGARNLAMLDQAADLPAAVASQLLGLSVRQATRWGEWAAAHRAAYAAELIRRQVQKGVDLNQSR
nr:hypothetical protein OG296_31390 [Streptomyces sp. NBC_01001]